jgi:NADH/F420H2 dehydrogenase subunit C
MLYTFLRSIIINVPSFIKKVTVSNSAVCLYTKIDNLIKLMLFLKHHTNTRFIQLSEITAVDFMDKDNRFEIVYMLLSVRFNIRIIVKVCVNDLISVPSMVKIFPSSGWCEREIWDMFGIFFKDNFDLRRILTDYGFEGYPLRKDFPLSGYVEVRYDSAKNRVVCEPLEMTQEFRLFDFTSSWEKGVK